MNVCCSCCCWLHFTRYLICTSQKYEEWVDALQTYRTNPVTMIEPMDIFHSFDSNLDRESQFRLLNSIPNYHQWQWIEGSKIFLVRRVIILDLQEIVSSKHFVIAATKKLLHMIVSIMC